MRKIGLILLAVIYIVGIAYLLLPNPKVVDLPGATKSNEPGDTWQNPNTVAYFTNMSREDVVNFYKHTYALKIGNWEIPSLKLNYPPEDNAIYIRKYVLSYYLEEMVHPFRESVFVNGWNPQLSPLNARLTQAERDQQTIVVDGKVFSSKVTLRWYPSPLWARLLVWTLFFPGIYLTGISLKNSLSAVKRII